jgi:hypothetical protein
VAVCTLQWLCYLRKEARAADALRRSISFVRGYSGSGFSDIVRTRLLRVWIQSIHTISFVRGYSGSGFICGFMGLDSRIHGSGFRTPGLDSGLDSQWIQRSGFNSGSGFKGRRCATSIDIVRTLFMIPVIAARTIYDRLAGNKDAGL